MQMMNDDEEDKKSSSTHVAWADRIGLARQWARDIEACSDSYGVPGQYIIMVKRFFSNIPNLKDGLPLHDLILERENELLSVKSKVLLEGYLEKHPDDEGCEASILKKKDEIRLYLYEELYRYILQLLEDSGFGIYKSRVEEDEMS